MNRLNRFNNDEDALTGLPLRLLIMVIIAGILSCGLSFAFVYSQGPIRED